MVPSDRALATSYRLSIVTMSPSVAVLPQFEKSQAVKPCGRIPETARDRDKVTINH